MKRGPTTFSLILGLFFVAIVVALTMAASLSLRFTLHAAADNYAHLLVATATVADELKERNDVEALKSLGDLQRVGLAFSSSAPAPPSIRIAPMLVELERSIGEILGDPQRVVATQAPEPQIWIRSQRDTSRWIVMTAAVYRTQLARSTILIMLLAGLIALAVAAIGARLLTRPLERLANNADSWIAGASVSHSLRGSPREVRALAASISNASERLRSAARDRELMLAGVSHDLRTPLARLRLALELGDADDPLRRSAMVEDLEQLDSALEQCLAFVRDGRDEAVRDVDVATIAGQLIGLRRQPEDWNLDSPPTVHAGVRPVLVRRALANLMDNAERYGAAPFEIAIKKTGAILSIDVRDRGKGVRAELLDQLGQPFVRGDRARGGGGSGLGLSIVVRIAQLHGGSLHLSNRNGGGFSARIDLPDATTG